MYGIGHQMVKIQVQGKVIIVHSKARKESKYDFDYRQHIECMNIIFCILLTALHLPYYHIIKEPKRYTTI